MRAPLHHTAHPLLAAAGLLYLVGVPFGLLAFFDERPHSVVLGGLPYLVESTATLAGSVCLLLGVVALGSHEGPRGAGLGGAALAGGVVALVAHCFVTGVHAFLQPYLAVHAPQTLDLPPDGTLAVGFFGSLVVYVVGMVALAVSGLRSGVLPRGAAVLLAAGAIGTFGGPFASVLLGAGTLWAGVAGLRRRAVPRV